LELKIQEYNDFLPYLHPALSDFTMFIGRGVPQESPDMMSGGVLIPISFFVSQKEIHLFLRGYPHG
jgi:hypothetical protein